MENENLLNNKLMKINFEANKVKYDLRGAYINNFDSIKIELLEEERIDDEDLTN